MAAGTQSALRCGRRLRGAAVLCAFCASALLACRASGAPQLKWARRAADAGNPEGMALVGLAYFKGDEARRWENRAAASERAAEAGGKGSVTVSPAGPAAR